MEQQAVLSSPELINHPTYLLTLYHYTFKVNGDDATFHQSLSAMNAKAAGDKVITDFQTSEG